MSLVFLVINSNYVLENEKFVNDKEFVMGDGYIVIHLFSAEMHPKDNSYEALCKSLGQLSHVDTSVLQAWLSKMLTNTVQTSATSTSKQDSGNSKSHENRLLLQSLTKYIVKSNSHMNEDVCSAILSALLPMGLDLLTSSTTDAVVFTELMVVMTTLAGSGSGQGHVQLFKAALKWMNMCQVYLSEKKLIEKLEEGLTGGKVCVISSNVYLCIQNIP